MKETDLAESFFSLEMTQLPHRKYTLVEGQEVLTHEYWILENSFHRVDGPAIRKWQLVGDEVVLTREGWYLKGRPHRVDGPACREWRLVDGRPVLIREEWWLEGERHRVDGPAHQRWVVMNGKAALACEDWYLEGVRCEPFALPSIRQSTTTHLQRCGLVIWPGLMDLIDGYLV